MIFYVDSSGQVQCVSPKTVKQGSVGVSKIRLFGAFAPNNTVMLAFELPHGQWTTPQYMAKPLADTYVEAKDGTKYYIWEYALGGTVTAISGVVKVQFFVYDGTDESTMLSSGIGSFMVAKGVPITIPKPSEEMNELLTQINNFLATSDRKALTMGAGRSSVEQQPFVYDGENVDFSDGTKGTQKGDTVPGAEAKGEQSVALGGLRWDYHTNAETLADNKGVKATYEEHFGRTPTSAEGKQSFAAGGSVHAYGDWSVAMGKDTKTYQGASISVGGGNIAGMPKEIFDAIQNGENTEIGETNDEETRGWELSYSFGFSAGSGNKSYGRNSFTANGQNEAWMTDSSAFGNGNKVYSRNGFATGQSNILKKTADNSSVSGRENTIHAKTSSITGTNNTVSGQRHFASGNGNNVSGDNNLISGDANTVAGWNSAVFGASNTLHSCGQSTITGYKNTNSGNHSFVSGTLNENTHESTALIGRGLKSGRTNSTIVGMYNPVSNNDLFGVGNGSSDSVRSWAFEVLADGRAKVHSAPQETDDVVRLQELDTKVASIKGTGGTTRRVYLYNGNTDEDTTGELIVDNYNSSSPPGRGSVPGYWIGGQLWCNDPINSNNVANKKYVDSKTGVVTSHYLTKISGTSFKVPDGYATEIVPDPKFCTLFVESALQPNSTYSVGLGVALIRPTDYPAYNHYSKLRFKHNFMVDGQIVEKEVVATIYNTMDYDNDYKYNTFVSFSEDMSNLYDDDHGEIYGDNLVFVLIY